MELKRKKKKHFIDKHSLYYWSCGVQALYMWFYCLFIFHYLKHCIYVWYRAWNMTPLSLSLSPYSISSGRGLIIPGLILSHQALSNSRPLMNQSPLDVISAHRLLGLVCPLSGACWRHLCCYKSISQLFRWTTCNDNEHTPPTLPFKRSLMNNADHLII